MEFPLTQKTNGGNRIGTPIPGGGHNRLRRNVGEIAGIALHTGSSGVHGKKRDGNQVDLAERLFLIAASLYQFHVEGSIFSETPIGLGQHTRDVGEAQTGSLPEKPAQRSFSEIAQLDVSFAGGFRNSAFPTGDRHGRHTESVAETLLAQLAFMTHVLDLAGPLWNNGFGISTHGLSPQKKLLSSERTRATVVGNP
jgi:hypothetical protein